MKRKLLFWTLVTAYFVTCYLNLFTLPVHAYIDPSAVTYVIQAVAGVLIALGAAATIFRHKIIAFFKKGKGDGEKRQIHLKEEEETGADDTKADA